MSYLTAFAISVLAGVVSYYICKWLDGDLRIFEVVLRLEEIGKLPEAYGIDVMTGYYAVLLEGNDVADRQAGPRWTEGILSMPCRL